MADFDSLAAVRQTSAVGKTLVRSKLNFRASVFGCLYQILQGGTDLYEVIPMMQSTWVPNDTRQAFMIRVMNEKVSIIQRDSNKAPILKSCHYRDVPKGPIFCERVDLI